NTSGAGASAIVGYGSGGGYGLMGSGKAGGGDYSVGLVAREAVVPAKPMAAPVKGKTPAYHAHGESGVEGKGDDAVKKTHEREVQQCYEQARAARPALQGKVSMAIDIAADGSVTGVNVEQSPDTDLSACVKKVARKWKVAPGKRVATMSFVLGGN